jgi:hypothetical protein
MLEVLPVRNFGPSARVRDSEHWSAVERQLPAARRLVLYETQSRIQVGYVDESAQWRRLNGALETQQVLSWMVAPRRASTFSNQ